MKSNIVQLKFKPNANMTGTSTINSDPIALDQIYGFAVQAFWTGTPVGNFKLQVSCDAPGDTTQTSNGGPDKVTNWTDLTGSTQAAGGLSYFVWNINGAFYRYVRLVYTNTSGSGVLKAQICLKGV